MTQSRFSNIQTSSSTSLPQYGFADNLEFSHLFKQSPYLFRVFTPKELSPFADDTDPYFLAPKFNEAYSSSPQNLSLIESLSPSMTPSYTEVIRHLDWTTRSTSSFISTSFSFVWSIWESLRRYHTNFKHDVHIAIINAEAVSHHCFTAAQILNSATPTQRHVNHWKWYQHCQESQTVLVYGCVPPSAVYASIPLLSILERLPSYFLHSGSASMAKSAISPLHKVAWNYTSRKLSYRQFCRDMSDRFLQLPFETRLRDTTAGSVRLAVGFLSPWFHETIPRDFSNAVVVLSRLSLVISQWPGQWWSREHYAEISDVIQAISLVLAEEVRNSLKAGASHNTPDSETTEDVSQAKTVTKVKVLSAKCSDEDVDSALLDDGELRSSCPAPLSRELPSNDDDTLVIRPIIDKEIAIRIPQLAAIDNMTTPRPLTPVEGSSQTPTRFHDILKVVGIGDYGFDIARFDTNEPSRSLGSDTESASDIEMPIHPTVEDAFLSDSETACGDEEPLHITVKVPEDLPTLSTALTGRDSEPESESESESEPSINTEPSDFDTAPPGSSIDIQEDMNVEDWIAVSSPAPVPVEDTAETPKSVRRQSPSALETASYALTCFLIGTFITLCVLSPHRRALATHLT